MMTIHQHHTGVTVTPVPPFGVNWSCWFHNGTDDCYFICNDS